jgi:hypothetical protein
VVFVCVSACIEPGCSTLVRSTLQIVVGRVRFLYSTPSGAFFLPASIVFLFFPNHRNHKRLRTTPHCGDGSRDHVCLFLYVCIPALAGSNKIFSQLIYEIDIDVTYRYFWRIHLSRYVRELRGAPRPRCARTLFRFPRVVRCRCYGITREVTWMCTEWFGPLEI